MIREELLTKIRKKYISSRLQNIEPEFLEYEEEMVTDSDLQKLLELPSSSSKNPHNSTLLYATGVSDTYDILRPVHTIGGSPPDVDVDFDAIDFHKIVGWVTQHYGREQVANIMALQKFKLRSTVHKYFMVSGPAKKDYTDDSDYKKAVRAHEGLCTEILSKLPPALFGKEPTLEEAIKGNPKKGYKGAPELATDARYAGWYKVAQKLENMVSAFSVHAAGIVIANEPISNVLPIWTKKEKGEDEARWITQFTMQEVEALGLLKCDFLRIDNLSIIKEAIRLIEKHHGLVIDPYTIPDRDARTYKLLNSGFVAGVFQMEASRAAKILLKQIKPSCLGETSDLSALNRPGPQQAGLTTEYVENKSNGYPPAGMPKAIAEILKDTYYCMVYQEQLMALIHKIAGFSLKETDKIRRAVGKKDEKKLAPYRQAFIDGCVKNKISVDYASAYWKDVIIGLADYQFNKSHSLAYSYITYICAWLKAHYPAEFFTALMSVRSKTLQTSKWAVKAPDYVREARQFNIGINQPDINKSSNDFTMNENEIYFGFPCIAKVGETASNSIVDARGDKPFTSLYDFLSRVNRQKINTGVFGQLVFAGCFDSLGYSRQALHNITEEAYNWFAIQKEYEERLFENQKRENDNIAIEALIKTRNEIRLRAKKKGYICTPEEEEVLTQTKGLTLKKPLALPELVDFPSVPRSKRISLSTAEILDQGKTIGCFIIHPATIVYPEAVRLSDLDDVGTYDIAGIVDEIKVYKNTNGNRHYATISDGTGSVRLPFYEKVPPSVGKLIKVRIRGGYPNSIDNDAEVKVHSIYWVKVYGES